MKNDLKDVSIATVIYLGLLIIGTLLFFGYWLASDRYPALDNIVTIFGVVFYTIIIIYSLIHWFARRQHK